MSILLGLRRGDLVLIAVLAVTAVSAAIFLPILLADDPDMVKEVVVTIDGDEIFRHPFTGSGVHTKDFLFAVQGAEYTGVLEFRNGEVLLQRLDQDIVPLAIHRDMGPIRHTYQSIIALPVKLMVRIEAAQEEDLGFDVVAH